MRRHSIVAVLALFAASFIGVQQSWGGPCCSWPQSILKILGEADIVVVGRLQNAVESDNAAPKGQTELVIDEVIKSHKTIEGRKSVILPGNLPNKGSLLIAIEVSKDSKQTFDPFYGLELEPKGGGALVKYVRSGLQLKDKSSFGRLKHNAEFLHEKDAQVLVSVLAEFSEAKYADIRKLGESMKPEPLVKVLTAEETQPQFRGPFAMLLAHCGRPEDARTIRKLIDSAEEAKGQNALPSLIVAYVLLERKVGWDLVVKNSELPGEASFLVRYHTLQAVRLLWAERKDVVTRKQWEDFMLRYLARPDVADFVIDDLRKAKAWDQCDRVLEVFDLKEFNLPINRRAVLRYALQCPSPKAAAFVAAQRARDQEWVDETKALLELEE